MWWELQFKRRLMWQKIIGINEFYCTSCISVYLGIGWCKGCILGHYLGPYYFNVSGKHIASKYWICFIKPTIETTVVCLILKLHINCRYLAYLISQFYLFSDSSMFIDFAPVIYYFIKVINAAIKWLPERTS